MSSRIPVYLVRDAADLQRLLALLGGQVEPDLRTLLAALPVAAGDAVCDACEGRGRQRRFVAAPDACLAIEDNGPCSCPCHPIKEALRASCDHLVGSEGWCLCCDDDPSTYAESDCDGALHLNLHACLSELRQSGHEEIATELENVWQRGGLPPAEATLPFTFTDQEIPS